VPKQNTVTCLKSTSKNFGLATPLWPTNPEDIYSVSLTLRACAEYIGNRKYIFVSLGKCNS